MASLLVLIQTHTYTFLHTPTSAPVQKYKWIWIQTNQRKGKVLEKNICLHPIRPERLQMKR